MRFRENWLGNILIENSRLNDSERLQILLEQDIEVVRPSRQQVGVSDVHLVAIVLWR